MLSKEIKDILRENERYNMMLARYDETGEFDLDRIRRSFTIRRSAYRKLRQMSEAQRKPMSQILDGLIEGLK